MQYERAERAMKWICALLDREGIAFRVAGGLAARWYGSDRPLVDIDLDVPEESLEKIASLVPDFVKFGPARFLDETWDLELLTLMYRDQQIDLNGAHRGRVFDKKRNTWVTLQTDFSQSPQCEILGCRVRVIPKDELVAYKSMLAREVDLLDVEAITKKEFL